MRLSAIEKDILKKLVIDNLSYEYFVNYLSNENNINTKEYKTIKSILKYKLKETVLLKELDITIYKKLDNSGILVYINIDSSCNKINIPKDWFNISIYSEKNGLYEKYYRPINKDYTIVDYKYESTEPKIVINSIKNLDTTILKNSSSMLSCILNYTIQIVDTKSILEYIIEINKDIIDDSKYNFKEHITYGKFNYRQDELSKCTMIIYQFNLVNTYKKEFESLDYKVYTLYNALRCRLSEIRTSGMENVIINTGIKEIKHTYLKIIKILEKELKQWI